LIIVNTAIPSCLYFWIYILSQISYKPIRATPGTVELLKKGEIFEQREEIGGHCLPKDKDVSGIFESKKE
jgi:hypothetical protein